MMTRVFNVNRKSGRIAARAGGYDQLPARPVLRRAMALSRLANSHFSGASPPPMTETRKPFPQKRFGKDARPQRKLEKPRLNRGGFLRTPQPEGDDEDGPIQLYGLHAVEAALRNPERRVRRLLITDNAARRLEEALSGRLEEALTGGLEEALSGGLEAALAGRGLEPESVSPRDLDKMLGPDTVHQGVMLEVEPLPEPELQDLLERAASGGPLIVLDQVTDPHNVGAVLRSAAVFGASGLVTTRRHSPPPNGTLAKSASGALELVPLLRVQNLARTLDELKSQGFVLIGLDGEAETAIEDEPFDRPTALVLGAEGKGLRQLTRETCHRLVHIETAGTLASLNVSNAAAVALHMAAMRRKARAKG
jgi:23S rRNA (guanosine2251-2'-O)-methyltransferase